MKTLLFAVALVAATATGAQAYDTDDFGFPVEKSRSNRCVAQSSQPAFRAPARLFASQPVTSRVVATTPARQSVFAVSARPLSLRLR